MTRAIARLIRDGLEADRIAVLYRAGSTGLGFQGALEALGIPFDVRGGADLWQSAAAKLFLGSLFYLLDADDHRAIERMGSGKRGETARRKLDRLPDAARRDFAIACRHVRRVVSDILPKTAAEREQRDWAGLCDAIGALAAGCTTLDDLLGRIADQSRALRRPAENAVVLSTIHSAKGLEWEAVFVVGLEEGLMPSAGTEIEEERRVAYVGVTRILGLTYAAERGGRTALPSRFIAEFAGDTIAAAPVATPGADDALPLGPPFGPLVLAAPARTVARGGDAAKRKPERRATVRDRNPEAMPPYAPDHDAAAAQWTARDDAKLQASFAVAQDLDEICAATGKSAEAVLNRLARLKLVASRAAARAAWQPS